MTAIREAYDVDTLAAALLPLLKAQSRITRTDEDQQATEIIARAIGRIERQCGIAIAPQSWAWVPRATGAAIPWNATTEWQLSVAPVRGIDEVHGEDADGVPFSDFTLHAVDLTQGAFAEVRVTRPNGVQPDDVFTIDAGWADPTEMPPELRDTLIRYAANLWEFRESWFASSITSEVPEWVTEAIGIFWVPKV